MAAQFTFIVLLAVLQLTTFSPYCSAENEYCVTPTPNLCSSCPHNVLSCISLSEFPQKVASYFTPNITMVILPGDHVLNRNITISYKSKLIMHGDVSSGSQPTITCNGLVGFLLYHIEHVHVSSLSLTLCSRIYTIPPDLRAKFLLGLQYAYERFAIFLFFTQYAELVNCSFHNNTGTALLVSNSNVTFAGNNEFIHNHCAESNSCVQGGGIAALNSSLTFIGNTTFLENVANLAGAGIFMGNSWLISTGNIYFINNSNLGHVVVSGVGEIFSAGTIWASKSKLHFSGTSNFINNTVWSDLFCAGGAIYAQTYTSVSFTGVSSFQQNSACAGGAIFLTNNSVLNISGSSNFSCNHAVQGGAITLRSNSNLTFQRASTIHFTRNGHDKGVLGYGGGMFLDVTSTFSVLSNTTVYWVKNHATFGGAIYVADQIFPLSYCTQIARSLIIIAKKNCFFQLPAQNLSNSNVHLVFTNNTADDAGSVLYGGITQNCTLTALDVVHIEDDNATSRIFPDKFHICPCENNHPNCSKPDITYTVYPGETFHVSVVAFGRRNQIVPARVGSRIQLKDSNLRGPQYSQKTISNTCTPLNYTVFSLSRYVLLELYADEQCATFGDIFNINLTMNQTCPPGFTLSKLKRSCACDERLVMKEYTNNCTITNGVGKITRDSRKQFWIGYDNQTHGLILHPHCPFDYCVNDTVVFPLNNTDIQCAYNRSGLLCGACKTNYSLVLGNSQCWKCTNNYLSLLVLFAAMGVVLVFLLLVCKLTVATGTLSGLVFYANIVGPNRTSFQQADSINPLSVFIAWLNLDFGIETCFYDGLNAYTKTWLQFVFPLYIWVVIGLLILISNCSHKFANLLGNNPVSVLATLILLSYTKILRTLITTVYFTNLDYSAYSRSVWLYNANIDYLSGKHIPLFLAAVLVFLFLFLPYTLLLVFGQWLPVLSRLRLFSWVNNTRLKGFLDTYHAPYKAKHRYWPGLLLFLRFALLLVFALNSNPNINLVAILVGVGFLQLWAWISGGVYRNWCLDALEGSFALNLIILAAFTNVTGEKQYSVWYASVSVALVTFTAIFSYHIFKQLKGTKPWKKMPKVNFKFNKLFIKEHNDDMNSPLHACEAATSDSITHTEVDLHELRSPLDMLDTK